MLAPSGARETINFILTKSRNHNSASLFIVNRIYYINILHNARAKWYELTTNKLCLFFSFKISNNCLNNY